MTMLAQTTIRQATAADAFALSVVGAATFLEAFVGIVPGDAILAHCRKNHVPEAYESTLALPESRAWLAEVEPGAAPVGYAMLTAPAFPADVQREGDLELRRIYLLARYHGGASAPRLMQCAVDWAREQRAARLLLGVHPENYRALAFYAKSGFVVVGERKFQVGSSTFLDPVLALTL